MELLYNRATMSLVDSHHRLTNKKVQCQKGVTSFGVAMLNLLLYIDLILHAKRNEPIS